MQLELDDTDLEKIKNETSNIAKSTIHCYYLQYLLDNKLIISENEPSKGYHKFSFLSKEKLRLAMGEKFENFNKLLMISDFSSYLIKTNKIATSILKYEDDYYLESYVI